jgi:hypothetical protein
MIDPAPYSCREVCGEEETLIDGDTTAFPNEIVCICNNPLFN